MTRKISIQLARVAGYHNDTSSFTRLIIESGVNRQLMNEAFFNGKAAKESGMKCSCYQRNPKSTLSKAQTVQLP